MDNKAMNADALAARRAYYREWRKKNKDSVRESNRRYWEKRAAREQEVREHDTLCKNL